MAMTDDDDDDSSFQGSNNKDHHTFSDANRMDKDDDICIL